LNKPAGFVTSLSDPHHDRTVIELIAGVKARVFPVGRLDLDTEEPCCSPTTANWPIG